MQKNAVTNLEMLQAAARLHLITGEAAYLDKAKRVWGWLTTSPLLGADGLIGDALSGDASVQCDCCNGTSGGGAGKPRCVRMKVDSSTGEPSHVWSYDQGMFVGAAALLHRATNDSAYAAAGLRTVHAILSRLTTSGGVLREDLRASSSSGGRVAHVPAGPPPCTGTHDPVPSASSLPSSLRVVCPSHSGVPLSQWCAPSSRCRAAISTRSRA